MVPQRLTRAIGAAFPCPGTLGSKLSFLTALQLSFLLPCSA